jgi:hypothetical protein
MTPPGEVPGGDKHKKLDRKQTTNKKFLIFVSFLEDLISCQDVKKTYSRVQIKHFFSVQLEASLLKNYQIYEMFPFCRGKYYVGIHVPWFKLLLDTWKKTCHEKWINLRRIIVI